jgi:hypothetical protein
MTTEIVIKDKPYEPKQMKFAANPDLLQHKLAINY